MRARKFFTTGEAREPDRPWKALLWMTLSGMGFAGMGLFVKILSDTIPQFELVFFRSAVNFLIQLVVVLFLRVQLFPKAQIPLLLFRGLMGFLGLSCFFFAIGELPLTISAILNWTSPIFVVIFSALLLKEVVPRGAVFTIAVAFVGLVLLVDPFHQTQGLRPSVAGLLVGVLGAAFAGMAYVSVRAATASVGVNIIILYFTGVATVLSAPLALTNFRIPNTLAFFQLLAVGVLASVGQFAMTQGYRHARAGIVGTMSLMNAAFMALFGWVILDERLALLQWLGMLVLAAGVAATTLIRNKN